MANKPAAALRDLSDDHLIERLAEEKDSALKLRFRLVTGQLDNSSRLGVVRKDIARIKTILRDREIEAAEAAEAAEQAAEGVTDNG